MKKLWIILIAGILFLSPAMAQESKGDCGMVVSVGDFASLENWRYENILPQKAVEQAMVNLKNFCCEEKVYDNDDTCTQDINIKDGGIYPSSVYLYDHILDVSMRRLDAKTENENGEDLIYGLAPDETGKIWREFITKHANSKDGSIPLEITTKFKENWEIGDNSIESWNYKIGMPWGNQKFENYGNWNLVDKYNAVCETSIYLYINLSSIKDTTRLGKAYRTCETLTQDRIKKEFDYTKAVLMQKGNKLLFNNVQSYLSTYFSQNKLISLQQLMFNIKNTFNEINKAVIELVPNCS